MKLLILGFVLLLLPVASAQVFNATPICSYEQCVRGGSTNWSITITNFADDEIEITQVELLDVHTDARIGYFNATEVYLASSKSATIIAPGRFPLDVPNDTLSYTACFTIDVPLGKKFSSTGVFFGTQYESCPSTILKMPLLECGMVTACPATQYCVEGQCLDLVCGECQYPVNNTCHSFDCCSSSHCNLNSFCQDNTCTPLNCADDERLYNHTCIPLDCDLDEYAVNHKCVPLSCKDNEYAADHRCLPLNCTPEQRIENHRCLTIQCRDDEYLFNGTCQKLNCSVDQKFENHNCVELSCWYFQDAIAHQCVVNQQLVRTVLLEFISIVGIIGVGMLYWHKYRHLHGRKK